MNAASPLLKTSASSLHTVHRAKLRPINSSAAWISRPGNPTNPANDKVLEVQMTPDRFRLLEATRQMEV
jgi:hypothetical protein